MPVKADNRGRSQWHEEAEHRGELTLKSGPVLRLDPPGEPPDPEGRDRILGKLNDMWRQVPDWRLAWLILNLVPPGPTASDAEIEIEIELDRLLNLDLD
jgi:hypothetical protein